MHSSCSWEKIQNRRTNRKTKPNVGPIPMKLHQLTTRQLAQTPSPHRVHMQQYHPCSHRELKED